MAADPEFERLRDAWREARDAATAHVHGLAQRYSDRSPAMTPEELIAFHARSFELTKAETDATAALVDHVRRHLLPRLRDRGSDSIRR
jgi:hypothetical protein